MSKFIAVTNAPEKLEKGEAVIYPPDFLEQIKENKRKEPKNKQTAINHLREILQSIANKYDPELNIFKVPVYKYEGINYASDEELNKIVAGMLRNDLPKAFSAYLKYHIAHRPMNTKLVYFVGNFADSQPFYEAGLDHIEARDIEAYMTGKYKKQAGKTALTKEEAEERKGKSDG